MQDDTHFDAAVVGNVGIDTNIYLYGEDIDFSVEANFSQNIDYLGQAGGYTGRGYNALGKRTAFIGHVGEDYHGRYIRECFTADGIDTRGLFTDPTGTARSINFMYKDGRRKNFYDGKGHMDLSFSAEQWACIEQVFTRCTLAHFHLPNWARYLLPLARQYGVKIACDIQDVVHPDDDYRRDFIKYADVLFFSAVNYVAPAPIIDYYCHLADNPDVVVIVGRGANGCMVGTRKGIETYPAVELPDPVIDTNGAGDGLATGFLSSYLLDGFSLEDSVLRGQIAARHTCTLKATSEGLISRELLDRYDQALRRPGVKSQG